MAFKGPFRNPHTKKDEPEAYARIVHVELLEHREADKRAVINYWVYVNEQARIDGADPIAVIKDRVDTNEYDTYFDVTVLDQAGENPKKKGYEKGKAQGGPFADWSDA